MMRIQGCLGIGLLYLVVAVVFQTHAVMDGLGGRVVIHVRQRADNMCGPEYIHPESLREHCALSVRTM